MLVKFSKRVKSIIQCANNYRPFYNMPDVLQSNTPTPTPQTQKKNGKNGSLHLDNSFEF